MADPSPVVVAVDQGTGSTKAIAVDGGGRVVARRSVPVGAAHPRPGWVEQDASELADSVIAALRGVVEDAGAPVVAVGLSAQRESALVWDRATGRALGPVLGWQDRRTAARAAELGDQGERVRRVTGLPLDPMFSALKLEWLLDELDLDRSRAAAGELAVGTVDSYLVQRLTGQHRIEAGSASRTQLLDVDAVDWDAGLASIFRIPLAALPRIADSDETAPLLPGLGLGLGLGGVPLAAVLGDSHAALYGHGIRRPGTVKATLGTGASIMGVLPDAAPAPAGLARTIAWRRGGDTVRAFEGNILAAGAALAWLAGLLGRDAGELARLAEGVETLHGVDLVPAFAGLGAPWWDEGARAELRGFTLGTGPDVLARAALDAIALQVDDVLRAAEAGTGTRIDEVRIDGGPSANPWFVGLLADLAQRRVVPSRTAELSAFGAAALAAEAVGAPLAIEAADADADATEPRLDAPTAARRRASWEAALATARGAAAARDSTTDNETGHRSPTRQEHEQGEGS